MPRRLLHSLLAMVLGGLGALPALAQGPGRVAAERPDSADYALHEWGVFPVARSAEWAMADLLAEWKTFPGFFQGKLPGRKLAYRGPVSKPVIWIHGAEPRGIELSVVFAEGRPLIWWPTAEEPSQGGFVQDARRLRFSLGINQCLAWGGRGDPVPPERWPEPPAVAADHWVTTLRSVDSARLFTRDSYGFSDRYCSDSFVYYDGVMVAPPSPEVRRSEGGIELRVQLDHAARDALCIERRDGRLFCSDWFELEAGPQRIDVPMRAAEDEEAAVAAAKGALISRAVRAGLNPDEAIALGEVWEEGFFRQPGLQLLYRIPPSTYERWLPLKATPAPRETVRVGLVLHRRLEPELESEVRALLARVGDEEAEEATWRAAAAELATIGGAAFPWIDEVLDSGQEPLATRVAEVKASLQAPVPDSRPPRR